MRTYISSVLAGAFFIAMTTAALAVTDEYENMCTMGLANGKDIKTAAPSIRRFKARPIASAANLP